MKKILITGAAGFIGYHLSQKLLKEGYEIYGIDNLNDYYDPALKQARLVQLQVSNFKFQQLDLMGYDSIQLSIFRIGQRIGSLDHISIGSCSSQLIDLRLLDTEGH